MPEEGLPSGMRKLLGVRVMFITLILVMFHVKTYQTTHFQYVQFIVCHLDLNLKKEKVPL